MKNRIGIALMLCVIVATVAMVVSQINFYNAKAYEIQEAETLVEQQAFIFSQYKDCLFCLVWIFAGYVLNKNIYYLLVKS